MGEHASTNMAIIEGALGKDPEFKEVDGRKIAKLLVATQEMWRERGELHSRTDWHTVHVSNARQVEAIEKSVRRGSRIRIEGLMKTLAHQSAEGHPRRLFAHQRGGTPRIDRASATIRRRQSSSRSARASLARPG